MHIPDGFLATNIWVSAWVLSAGFISFCVKKANTALKEKTIPLMGVMAAFIFAAQMINFPVIGGTSGHLLGGVLTGILVGPYAASIVLAVVLIVQCLIFQDGGLTALGANIFNMSILGTIGGYIFYALIKKCIKGKRGIIIGAALGAWFSVVLSSAACAVELAMSHIIYLKIVLPAMLSIHSLIGIGEAVITSFMASFILKVRPDLIYEKEERFL